MPASGADPITSALRIGLSAGAKINTNIDCIEASAKRVLQTRIRFEPCNNHHNVMISSLKAKYTVINTKTEANSVKSIAPNGVNSANKKIVDHLPVPKSILYPTERIQLGFRGNFSVGSGMFNVGNTCYLNSTLQALFHVPAFVNWLLNEPAHLKCEQNSEYQVHPDDITCAVIKTLKCSQQKTGSAMKPICIYSKLKAICKHLSLGSQEDAHEFMRYLLESLEKGFLTKVQGHHLESWTKETTPINQIFGGYIRTEVTCLSCHAVSTTFQHFQDLPLDIRRASTLDDALAGYFERERLPDGEDAYKCDKCGRKVAATKKYSLERPPNVLCIQLKRFSMMNGKLTKQVQLSQNLDLTRFVSNAVKPRHPVRYRLVSLVTHMGQSANCGHYTAIALAANGSYYQFDDNSVRTIPLSTVLSISAYLVLYELERPFPPCGPRAGATAAESTEYRKSESASVGGSDVKEPVTSGSPTAGSPAPCSNASAASTSLVPYDSDTDSDLENKETDSVSGGWKVSIQPPTQASPLKTTSASWRVTDVSPPKRSTVADMPTPSTGEARNPSTDRNDVIKPHNKTVINGNDRSRDVVSELIQNSHRGYGNPNVRTWNGLPSNMERQVDQERRENRKRTYDDEYNADFDRGKIKKKRFDFGRDHGRGGGGGRFNPFQQRANEQNTWRSNRYDYNHKFQRSNPGNWGFSRNHQRSYYNKHYNCSR